MQLQLILPTCLEPYFRKAVTHEMTLEDDHTRREHWRRSVLEYLAKYHGEEYVFKQMNPVEYEATDEHDLHLACPEEEGEYHDVSYFKFVIKQEFIPPLTRLPLP
jgi:hypothetical protein